MKISSTTGMVGEVMLKVLAERNFLSDTDELILVASERSVGKEIDFNGKSHHVVGLATAVAMQPDIAFFCRW
jgi:aspartate-semialdehyde dehydrogenase